MELHDAEEAIGMRKILADDMTMKKNPETKEETFCFFTDFHGVTRVTKSNLHSRTEISSPGVTNPDFVCYFFKYLVLIDFFIKKAQFDRKLFTSIGSNHLKMNSLNS